MDNERVRYEMEQMYNRRARRAQAAHRRGWWWRVVLLLIGLVAGVIYWAAR